MSRPSKTWLLICTVLATSWAFAQREKLSKDLKDKSSDSTIDVIVQFKKDPNEAHHRKIQELGGALKAELHSITGGAYSVPANRLTDLAADPDVTYVALDRPVHAFSVDNAAPPINAPYLWSLGYDGTGIGVAMIDSGTIDVPDLHGSSGFRVLYSQDFVSGGSANDTYGHGSHVAGIIAGNGKNSTGSKYYNTFKGIAPNVNLVSLRVLDKNGNGTDSAVISAIQTAINLKAKYNIRVINLSLGRPVFESYTVDPLCQAVEQAWKAGIVVVVAAGNEGRNDSANTDGYATITAPGNDPYVITVGAMKTLGTATRNDDLIASYSSKGPTLYDHVVKPDLVAPGNRLISLYTAGLNLSTQYPGNEIPYSAYLINGNNTSSSTYYQLSGTSMAAAVVSGGIADLLEAQPQLTPDQVKARLMKTAFKAFPAYSSTTDPTTGLMYTSQYDVFTVGAGYLDLQTALASTDVATGSALSPTVTYDSSTGTVRLVTGPGVVWGSGAPWATGVVWGSNTIDATGMVWGSGCVWGSSSLEGFGMVWGSGVVWGSSSSVASENVTIAIKGEN